MGTIKDDCTEQAKPLFEELKAEFEACRLDMSRGRSKLYSRVSPVDALFEGENFDVDLLSGTFRGLQDGEVESSGPLQLLGTYSDGYWLWAWRNQSVSPTSWQQIKSFIDGFEPLKKLSECHSFFCDEDFAEKLAQYVSVNAGWLGCYVTPNQNAQVYLLVKLTPYEGKSIEPQDNLWCIYCGRLREQVKLLATAAPNAAICDVCADRFAEMRQIGSDSGQEGDDVAMTALPPCLMCGQYVKRVFTAFGACCDSCVGFVQDAVAQQPKI